MKESRDIEGATDESPATELCPPRFVGIADERLIWQPGIQGQIQVGREALEQFVNLGEASPEEICAYAKRWGTLALCEHNKPAWHNDTTNLKPSIAVAKWKLEPYPGRCLPRGATETNQTDDYLYWEPLEAWRNWAKAAQAILRIASELHKGKFGLHEDWWVLTGKDGPAPTPPVREFSAIEERIKLDKSWSTEELREWKLQGEKSTLTGFIQAWMDLGRVRMGFDWHAHAPQMKVAARGLFGALALQISLAVSNTREVAACSHCGKLYMPGRRPRADQLNYCPDCGKKEAWRQGAARRRRKQKAGA